MDGQGNFLSRRGWMDIGNSFKGIGVDGHGNFFKWMGVDRQDNLFQEDGVG